MTNTANDSARGVSKKPKRNRPKKHITLSKVSIAAIPSMCKARGVQGLSALVDLLVAEEKARVEGMRASRGG